MSKERLKFLYHKFYNASDFGAKKLNILIYLFIAILSLDTIISQLSSGLGIAVSSSGGVILFVVLGFITIVCQLFILQFVSRTSLTVRSKVRHIRGMHVGVTVSHGEN